MNSDAKDPLLPEVFDYLNKFDYPLAYLIQKKFKIGFSRAEIILKKAELSEYRHDPNLRGIFSS
jgi:hypothetical protein